MKPIAVLMLSVLLLCVLTAPRRYALLSIMAGVLFLPLQQQVNVQGFNLWALRFLELAGFVRVLARRECSFFPLNGMDRALLLFYGYSTVVYLLRASEGQAYVIGAAVDACLCYFAFRGLTRDMEDFRWFLRALVVLLVPYVALVMVEWRTGGNPFAFLGGATGGVNWVREGSIRCFGSFGHPSLLGTLGASFLPLYIGLAFAPADRKRALIGVVLCLLIVVASHSGGPLSTMAFGLVAWSFWWLRTDMRRVRWCLVGLTLLAQLMMKSSLWYLPAKVSAFSGGSGWHRSYLMDIAFQNLDKWWFAGMPIEETADWFGYKIAATGGADITNQFLKCGLTAGLGSLVLFVLLLTRAFSSLGKALAVVRSAFPEPRATEPILWGLGVMLAAHIVNWLGITYFDQTYAIWFLQLATISTLSEHHAEAGRSETGEAAPADKGAQEAGPVPIGGTG